MSRQVDERVVSMQFDNKNFENGVQSSLSTLDKLKRSLNLDGATRGLENVDNAAKKVNLSILGDAADGVKLKFSSLEIFAVTALSNIANSLFNIGRNMVSNITAPIKSGFAEYETQINAVQTILANTSATSKTVVKQATAGMQSTASSASGAISKTNDAAIKSLQKTHKEELKSYQQLADEELEVLEEAQDEALKLLKKEHEEVLKEYEKLADEELDMLDEKHEAELDDLEKTLDEELKLFKEAHQEKLDLYEEEYMEKLKVVDEERYAKIKAIDDEINAINGMTKAEEEAIEISKQQAKLSKLQAEVDNAKTYEERVKAEEALANYKQELSRKQLLKEREAKIAELELDKANIEAEYKLIEDNLKAEYEAKKAEATELYELELEQLKDAQAEKQKALRKVHEEEKEQIQETLDLEKESIQELQNEELESLNKIHKKEKQQIQERLDLEKEAIQERQDAELDALRAKYSGSVGSGASNAAIVETIDVDPSTLEDVNKALDELNRYADKTIYNFTEMTRNIGTFTAAGIDLNTSVEAIKGIANLGAVSGSTSQQVSSAMYQLSQALASGKVSLMDWNSVVNAGMGGQILQDSLMETARVHGIAIDDIIAQQGNFRESLSTGWLSTDILIETLRKFTGDLTEEQLRSMGYTEEQIAGIIKMADMAVGAATEVKTLSQLFDTLKETAQSGWTQSWEIILGDFEEAKALFTEIYKTFSSILEASAESRNNLLEGALGAHTVDIDNWKSFAGEMGSAANEFQDALTETARMHNIDIDSMIEKEGSFSATLKNGWLTKDLVTETLSRMDEETLNASESIVSLAKAAEETGTPINKLMESMNEPTGRELLIYSFRNILSSIGTICTSVKEAFREIFPPMTSEQLYSLIEGFHSLTEKFKVGSTTAENIKRTFKGLFAVVGIVTDAIKVIWDMAIKPLIFGLDGLSGGLLNVTANFGDWLVALRDTINESGVFEHIIGGVVDAFDWLGGVISDAYGHIKPFVDDGIKSAVEGLDDFKMVLENIYETIKNLVVNGIDWLSGKFNGLKDAVKGVSEPMNTLATDGLKDTNKYVKALTDCMGGATNVLDNLSTKIKDTYGNGIVESIAKAFSDVTIEDAIGAGILGVIAVVIKKFIDKIKEFTDPLANVMESVSGVLNEAKGCLEAWQQSIKADILSKIAISVALLAASIFALSFVDGDSLTGGLIGVSVLLGEIILAMKLMGSTSFNTEGLVKSAAAIVIMSVAVSIMAGALAKMDDMSFGDMISSLVGLAGAMLGLVKSMEAISKIDINAKDFVVTSIGLILFATAVGKMADSMIALGQLSFDEIKTGLLTMAGILLELGLFLKNAGLDKIGNASSTITALAVSMLILCGAVWLFGKMDIGTLTQGFLAVSLLMLGLGLSMKLIGSADIKGAASTIMAMAIALDLLVIPIKMLGEMELDALKQGLIAVGLALLGITIAVGILGAVQSKVGSFTSVGTSLLLMATALAVIAIPIKTLGSMPWQSVALGLGALVIALAACGVTMALLAPFGTALITVAGALALFGVAIAGIGGGMLMLATGFTMLATLGTAGAIAASAAITTIIASLLASVPEMMSLLEAAIKAFAAVVIACAPVIGDAAAATLIEICNVIAAVGPALIETILILLDALLESIDEYLPSILDSAVSIIMTLLNELAEHMGEFAIVGIEIVLSFLDGVQSKMDDVTQKAFDMLLEFIKSMTNSIKENTPLLVEAMHDLIIALVDAGIEVLTGGVDTFNDAGEALMDSGLIEGIFSMGETLFKIIGDLILDALDCIKDNFPKWVEAGFNLIKKLIKGIGDIRTEFRLCIIDLINEGINKAKETFDKWTDIGKNIILGLVSGAKAKAKDLLDSVIGVIDDAIEAAKALLGIKSPSRVFKQMGIYCDEGMIIGLESMAGAVSKASEDVGKGAINSMASTIANISDVVANGIDAEPVITPVLDLSNVTSGMRQIDAAFSRNQALSISASRNRSNTDENQNGENNSSTGNTYQFTQNNYSPKALSRVEIYRQTKNQFSAMERMVNA